MPKSDNAPDDTAPKAHNALTADLERGSYLSEHQYYRVLDIDGLGVEVENERGMRMTIGAAIVDEGMFSASLVVETRKVTRTELAEILEQSGGVVFTVYFRKQVDAKTVAAEVTKSAQSGTIKDLEKILAKAIGASMKGERRTLVGYLASTEPKMGRSCVVDLEVPKGKHPLRLVDHRTLEAIVLRGVRWEVK